MAADVGELTAAKEAAVNEVTVNRAAADPTGHSGLSISALTRRYGARAVLDDIDLEVPAGQFVALVGRSGSGKSTLLRAIAGVDHEVEGNGVILGSRRVSMVFQDSRLLPWRRVLPNVLLGLPQRGPRRREVAERATAAIAEVGLAGREQAWPSELSGGEAQRAALARSLVREPELLLADEPFGALDALTRIRMHALLRELWSRHRPTVLLVTHDVDEAVLLADRALVLDKGRFVLDLPIDLPHPRTHRDPRLADYRSQLLVALGVPEEAEPPATESGPDLRTEPRSEPRSDLNRELQEVKS